jgi:FkbH-like protein
MNAVTETGMTVARGARVGDTRADTKGIKCVVWDLDDTLWDGALLEGEGMTLRKNVADIVRTLDERGILQSIASKNEHYHAMARLEELGLSQYFLYPQINWDSKAASVQAIARLINIGLDSIAFIDDQPFEREEVNFSLPEVLSIDARDLDRLLDMPEMNPRFITADSKARRQMYLQDQQRRKVEDECEGPKEEFLASLDLVFNISPAKEEDLQRAEELTVRTNQLNATGYTYSYDELNSFRRSPDHKLLVASLTDKYGSYGKIGLALTECLGGVWNIKLLLVSCRVMSRGVGTILLNHVMAEAARHRARLRAEFVPTDRNRMMYVTYKFAGFREAERRGEVVVLENDLTRIQPFPDYVRVNVAV